MNKLTRLITSLVFITLFGCGGGGGGTIPDGPWTETVETIDAQRQAYLTATTSGHNAYTELVQLYKGEAPDEDTLEGEDGLAKLIAREDTADFALPALLSILIRYGDSTDLSEDFKTGDTEATSAKAALLGYKYWPDELADYPRDDLHPEDGAGLGMDNACYWTENHYILFASGAYLAAQLYPDETFTASGETGSERMATFKTRILKWLELRFKTGFSEWLSNVYYNEDIPALLALIDCAEDSAIQKKATLVLDLMFADMALNHFNGTFGSTHGRTYTHKMSGSSDSTGTTFNLLFGLNSMNVGNYSASMLAASDKYQIPKVIYEMALADPVEYINKQRMSIAFEGSASKWGLNYNSLEDGMTFLTFEAYAHSKTINLFKNMLDTYNLWDNGQFAAFKENEDLINDPESYEIPSLSFLALVAEKDLTRNLRPEVNIYTYRTPDYMLSTAQDWRKSYGGDQQSIWQATLGIDATCFVTHPGIDDPSVTGNPSPSYWTGNGNLPRAIQVENVVISLYDITNTYESDIDNYAIGNGIEPALYFTDLPLYTHAYLPQGHYDEIDSSTASDGGYWIFAKKDDGYLALYTKQAYTWESYPDTGGDHDDVDHGGSPYEIKAMGEQNVWICELGRADDYVTFEAFKTAINNASITVTIDSTLPGTDISDKSAITVSFDSPSQGLLVMAWDGDLTQDGTAVNVSDYKRYDNPYSSSAYPGSTIEFISPTTSESLKLKYSNNTREASTLYIP